RPFLGDDAVHHRVADETVLQPQVLAEYALPDRPQPGDGCPRSQVAAVGLALHPHRVQAFEGMAQEQELGLGVDAAALPGFAEPGGADLQATIADAAVQALPGGLPAVGTAFRPAPRLGRYADSGGLLSGSIKVVL